MGANAMKAIIQAVEHHKGSFIESASFDVLTVHLDGEIDEFRAQLEQAGEGIDEPLLVYVDDGEDSSTVKIIDLAGTTTYSPGMELPLPPTSINNRID